MGMNEDKDFLRQDNDYRTLKAFLKAECIYDVTFYFAHKFLKAGDRTIDQGDPWLVPCNEAYDAIRLTEEMRRLAVQSFSKPTSLWDKSNAPVSGQSFDDYLRIARLAMDSLTR